MDASQIPSKRLLDRTDEAKSPLRILARSLLQSRNKLRAKYRELRVDCKRWRNQAAAVERSRNTWRERALASEASAQASQAARGEIESQLLRAREQAELQDAELAEAKARLNDLDGAKKNGSAEPN